MASEVPFVFEPNSSKGGPIQYTGTCQVRAVKIGGEPGTELESAFSFPVVGEPSVTGYA